MGRERYYKTTTDSTLTMDQKLEIIEGIRRGVASLKSKMIELPEIDVPLDLSKIPLFFKIFDHNSKFLSVWTDLTMGNMQPKNLFRKEREREIWERSVSISKKTGVPVSVVFDDYSEMMSSFLSPFV